MQEDDGSFPQDQEDRIKEFWDLGEAEEEAKGVKALADGETHIGCDAPVLNDDKVVCHIKLTDHTDEGKSGKEKVPNGEDGIQPFDRFAALHVILKSEDHEEISKREKERYFIMNGHPSTGIAIPPNITL